MNPMPSLAPRRACNAIDVLRRDYPLSARHVCCQTANRHLTYPVDNSEQRNRGVESRMDLLPSGRDVNLQRRVFTVAQIRASVLPASHRNAGDDSRPQVNAHVGTEETPKVRQRARLPDKNSSLLDEGALKAAQECMPAYIRMTTAFLMRGAR